MKNLIIIIFLFASLDSFAQNFSRDDFEKEIKPLSNKIILLQSENGKLKTEIGTLNSKLSDANLKIEKLQSQTQQNSNAITQTSNELGLKIQESGKFSEKRISAVDQSLSKNSIYGIAGVLGAVFISSLLYWFLHKRQKTDNTHIIEQLSQTKSSIEESLIKEFGKQTELMETQLQLIEQQKTSIQSPSNLEPDHSLALKVASEINLIERNINQMDSATRGIKQLLRSVGKLKDNLAANGYEIPELLGKQFHEGMKVIVTSSIPDENLENGSEVITKVLIPQVNYNDKMIQAAQIQVSVGI